MKNLNINEGEEMHTARGVSGDQDVKADLSIYDEVPVSSRRGRKGRSVAAQLVGEPDSSPMDASESSEAQGISRVIISQESSRCLDDLASRVNTGFEAGKVTRPQILNWVLRRFAETAGESEIQEVRAAHFDRIAYLEALLKRAKETGVLPPELAALAQPPCGSTHVSKKNKKPLTRNAIIDDTINDSELAS